VRGERWFSGEEITTLVASPLSCANDGDDDEDEEGEEEEKKKGDEDDEEEEEPVWTAPSDHRQGDGWSSYLIGAKTVFS
jgi:hypothetical protein